MSVLVACSELRDRVPRFIIQMFRCSFNQILALLEFRSLGQAFVCILLRNVG